MRRESDKSCSIQAAVVVVVEVVVVVIVVGEVAV
jgi:hypothetical protein